jgi:hypothetical protein
MIHSKTPFSRYLFSEVGMVGEIHKPQRYTGEVTLNYFMIHSKNKLQVSSQLVFYFSEVGMVGEIQKPQRYTGEASNIFRGRGVYDNQCRPDPLSWYVQN